MKSLLSSRITFTQDDELNINTPSVFLKNTTSCD